MIYVAWIWLVGSLVIWQVPEFWGEHILMVDITRITWFINHPITKGLHLVGMWFAWLWVVTLMVLEQNHETESCKRQACHPPGCRLSRLSPHLLCMVYDCSAYVCFVKIQHVDFHRVSIVTQSSQLPWRLCSDQHVILYVVPQVAVRHHQPV